MLDRRRCLRSSALATAGLALGEAPAFAQKRVLTMLSFNSFVPASDDELRKQAAAFGQQAGVEVRVDTISMAWAEDQVKAAVQGKLETKGKS
jgi:ABC-type glycerol-3-phosphate transport system substrate-binding protein